jgi:hypothetical protein
MPRQRPFQGIGPDVPRVLRHEPGTEPKRDRTWDEANPACSFRIREEDAARLAAQAKALGVSRDALARALLWAALDALEAGGLPLQVGEVTTEGKDKIGRVRVYTRRIVEPAEDLERKPNSDDCRGSFDAASNAAGQK